MREIDCLKKELVSVQNDYKTLVNKGVDRLNLCNYDLQKCLYMVDDIKRFWLERKDLIKYCLDELTDQEDCFILSAATFLQVDSYNQYSFKAVGDYQILPDPFIKMENFLRAGNTFADPVEIKKQFSNIARDTEILLGEYAGDFIFIDASSVSASSHNDRMETIHNSYVNFLKQIFNANDIDKLNDEFPTYKQIEEALPEGILSLLIFSDSNDQYLSLEDRVEKFLEKQKQILSKNIPKCDFDKFSFSLFCIYSQAIDTVLQCISLGFFPFFRNDVPVKYFFMLTTGYPDDEYLLKFIWKSIVGYFIGKEIEQIELDSIPFNDFAKQVIEEAPYNKIINSLQLNTCIPSDLTISKVANVVKPIINGFKH